MRKSNLLTSLLLTASIAWSGTSAEAAIPVGVGGAGPLTFGTAPVQADFAGAVLRGVGTTFADATTLDPAVQTIDVSSNFFSALLTVAEATPSTHAGAFRYNSTGRYLQARPTTGGTNAASVLLGTFQNTSGGDLPNLSLSYDFAVFVPLAGQLPGFNVYYSLTGLPNSWVVIPSLTQNEVAGNHSAALSLGSWPASALLYVLWVDDNADAITDPGYSIDNLAIALPGIPPSISIQPVPVTVAERQVATLSVSAAGSPPLSFQWFKGANAINVADNPSATTSTLTVTNTGASGRANSVPSDAGMYHVVVTGATAPPATSSTVQVTVNPDTNAPTFLYARCGTSGDQVVVVLSEPVLRFNGTGGDIEDTFAWALEPVSPAGPDLSPSLVTYVAGSTTVTLDFTPGSLVSSTSYRVKISEFFLDLAVTPNQLPVNSSTALYCITNELLTLNGSWRYNDAAEDLGPTWYTGPDSTLPSTGNGVFDGIRAGCRDPHPFGGPVGTCTIFSNATTLVFRTNQYFRTQFNFSGDPTKAILQLETYIDDGAIIYLNGTELTRLGMPDGVVTASTFATRTTNGEFERNIFPFTAQLINGVNVIAAQVHQVNYGSSDISWGCRVSALLSAPAAVAPVVTITPSGNNVSITWSPAAGTLQFKNALTDATWTDVPGGPHPAGGPVVVPASQAHRFYTTRQ